MFKQYFENELQRLREQASDFAKAHPATAPMLSGPTIDHGAERLLEGVAFLTGILNQKLDNEFLDFIKELIEIIYPHFVKPIPSTSMVMFEHKLGNSAPIIVKSGCLLNSNTIDGTSCQFQTLIDTEINPVKLLSANAVQVNERISHLKLILELNELNLDEWSPRLGLYFFLGGSYSSSTYIFMLLNHFLHRIIIKPESGDSEFILNPEDLKAFGLDIDNKLIDFPIQSFSAFRMIQEYFILPQKFTLMAITGFDKWIKQSKSNKFSIVFELYDIPEELPRINKDTFIFNVIPVVNLFDYEMEPITLNHKSSKLILNPSPANPNHYQVQDVKSVVGYKSGQSLKRTYLPLTSFKNLKSGNPVYQLIRGRSIVTNAPEASLFIPIQENSSKLSEETLSIVLACSNGKLTTKLKVGDICRASFNSPGMLNFSNIMQPTSPLEPPSNTENLRKFLSYLSMNFLSIINLQNIKELLQLYISSDDTDKTRLATNLKRIEGITALSVSPMNSLFRGAMLLGQKIIMEVDLNYFVSLGDVYLFGSIMNEFLSAYATMNLFTQFNLKEINTGVSFKWKPKLGNRNLI